MFEPGQKVHIRYGTYHNPQMFGHPGASPRVKEVTVDRMMAGNQIVLASDENWTYRIKVEDLEETP